MLLVIACACVHAVICPHEGRSWTGRCLTRILHFLAGRPGNGYWLDTPRMVESLPLFHTSRTLIAGLTGPDIVQFAVLGKDLRLDICSSLPILTSFQLDRVTESLIASSRRRQRRKVDENRFSSGQLPLVERNSGIKNAVSQKQTRLSSPCRLQR